MPINQAATACRKILRSYEIVHEYYNILEAKKAIAATKKKKTNKKSFIHFIIIQQLWNECFCFVQLL